MRRIKKVIREHLRALKKVGEGEEAEPTQKRTLVGKGSAEGDSTRTLHKVKEGSHEMPLKAEGGLTGNPGEALKKVWHLQASIKAL